MLDACACLRTYCCPRARASPLRAAILVSGPASPSTTSPPRRADAPRRAAPSSRQLNWTKWITLRFGFLNGWFGRGMFFLFVGTNIITWGSGKGGVVTGADVLSAFAGSACIFIGVVEILFGFKCGPSHSEGEDGGSEAAAQPAAEGNKGKFRLGFGGKPKAEGGTGEPAFTVNVTPNQLAQGATFMANNAGTVAAAANATQGGNSGAAANPFFGNAHLGNAQ